MAQTETQVVATELERVIPKLTMLFERDDKYWGTVKKKNVEVVSYREMRIPLELQPGGNFGYFNPDGGGLGRGGGPTTGKATLQSVFMSEAFEYTKLAEWSTNSNRKAITDAVRRLLAKGIDEMNRQLDSQIMGDGTGVIGTVTSFTTGGGADTLVLNTDGFGVKLVRFGQDVQVFDSALTASKGTATVSYYDVANNTIKLTPVTATIANGDKLVVKGLAAPSTLPALFGIKYHHSNASTGTWLGFNRANTPEIRASRVDANNQPLALPFPRLAVNRVGDRVGIDNSFTPDAWTHPCQEQAYEEIGQLASIINKTSNGNEGLNMYFGGKMQMAGANLKLSFNWDKKRIDMIPNGVWGRGETLPLGFYRTDGRNIFEIRSTDGGVATADIFYIVVGTQTFVDNPAAISYIDNLAIPTGY
jgi:hypothetical protein